MIMADEVTLGRVMHDAYQCAMTTQYPHLGSPISWGEITEAAKWWCEIAARAVIAHVGPWTFDLATVCDPMPGSEVEPGSPGVWVSFTYDVGPVSFAVHESEVEALRRALAITGRAVFLPYGEGLTGR